ncbi:class I SAM-dependent methyltransferase [Methanospirillum lacunae]|nr:methyltransferase domain-containing protein [Methanospirillum lacunae]
MKINEMTNCLEFNPDIFYANYPTKVILRPGYPARAQFKSTLMWDLYSNQIMNYLDNNCEHYADIGGCFGFGANSMAYQIFRSQGRYPKTKVFEIHEDYINIGKQLFPYIDFIKGDFRHYYEDPKQFDLISMFDIIEHISNPETFLYKVAKRTKLLLVKTPLETNGDWFGGKPPNIQGYEHSDGHINFFTPSKYIQLLNKSGFEIISGKCIKSIIPPNAHNILNPETELKTQTFFTKGMRLFVNYAPFYFTRKLLGGGDHICLAKSIYL